MLNEIFSDLTLMGLELIILTLPLDFMVIWTLKPIGNDAHLTPPDEINASI